MSRRGANGRGTISRRKDGRYAAAISLGPGKGRRWAYFKTKSEAVDWLNQATHDAKRGLIRKSSTPRLGTFLDQWLADLEASGKRRPKTLGHYAVMVKHLKSGLGTIRLDKLEVEDVQRLLNRKQGEVSPRSVHHMRAVLRNALNHAIKRGLIARNVAALAEPPAVPDREDTLKDGEATFLNVDQARRLIEAARGHRLEALITAAVALGLRQGEALGLQWADVDLEAGLLHVRKQLQTLPGRQPELVEVKTRRSRRTVSIPDGVVNVLREHREAQIAAGILPTGFVFATKKGSPLDHANVRKEFYALLEAAELPRIRFHDLRTSCASLLVAQGVHPRVAMEILGHSNISTTMQVYARVAPEVSREAAAAVNRALGF